MDSIALKKYSLRSDTLCNKRKEIFKTPVFYVLAVFLELSFFKFSINYLNAFLSAIVAALILYLYFAKGKKEFVAVLLLLANDSLGGIFGIVAVKYLSVLFILFEIIRNKNAIQIKFIPLLAFSVCLIIQPFITGLDNLNGFLSTLLPFLHLLILYSEKKDSSSFLQEFAEGVSIAVFLIAFNACITGGYSMYDEIEITGYTRKGILGVGDANFSCLILCMGVTCTINSLKFSKPIKLLLISIMVGAIAITLSTSGLISLAIVLVASILINYSLSRKISNFITLLIILAFVILLYRVLPAEMRFTTIDLYILRIEEKIGSFLIKDFSSLTTGRTDILGLYISFIENENIFRFVFGGNNLLQFEQMPHNTYIDFIVQYGILGFSIFMTLAAIGLLKLIRSKNKSPNKKMLITLKIVFLFFIASISVYHGVAFSLMLFVLIIV